MDSNIIVQNYIIGVIRSLKPQPSMSSTDVIPTHLPAPSVIYSDHPHWALQKIAIGSCRRLLAFLRLQRPPAGARERGVALPPPPDTAGWRGLREGPPRIDAATPTISRPTRREFLPRSAMAASGGTRHAGSGSRVARVAVLVSPAAPPTLLQAPVPPPRYMNLGRARGGVAAEAPPVATARPRCRLLGSTASARTTTPRAAG
jgi:hypothetical protein